MYCLQFKSKESRDAIYETGFVQFPFVKKLKINNRLIFSNLTFNSLGEDLTQAIESLNTIIFDFPDIAKKNFPIGKYSIVKIDDRTVSSTNKKILMETCVTRLEILKFCIFIHQFLVDLIKAKTETTDMIIVQIQKYIDDLENGNSEE